MLVAEGVIIAIMSVTAEFIACYSNSFVSKEERSMEPQYPTVTTYHTP